MDKLLDEKLCADFPKLFTDRYGNMQETAMCWGFECGAGWEPIIREASAKLEAINNKIKDPEQYIRASQIKEKYGTLRFYISSVPSEFGDEAFAATDEAEKKSEEICEECGKPGKLRGHGWLYTACDEHTKEQDKE
jgi:hypothetical protein